MRTLAVAAFTFAVALSGLATVRAQPQIPATFYGSATIDGKPAESGAEVRAIVNGVDCAQAAPGERAVIRDGDTSAYVVHVVHESQRPGCARDAATVTFTIGGRAAVQSAPWKPGPNRLDLSTGTAPPIPLPSPTGTIAAAINTAVAGTPGTGSATALARPSGVPPTDDVQFPGSNATRTPAPPVTSPGADSNGDGSNVTLWVVIALALLVAGGGIAGVAYSRMRSATDSAPPAP